MTSSFFYTEGTAHLTPLSSMIYKEQMVEQKDRRRKPATAEPHTVSESNALIPVYTHVLVELHLLMLMCLLYRLCVCVCYSSAPAGGMKVSSGRVCGRGSGRGTGQEGQSIRRLPEKEKKQMK